MGKLSPIHFSRTVPILGLSLLWAIAKWAATTIRRGHGINEFGASREGVAWRMDCDRGGKRRGVIRRWVDHNLSSPTAIARLRILGESNVQESESGLIFASQVVYKNTRSLGAICPLTRTRPPSFTACASSHPTMLWPSLGSGTSLRS